MRFTHERLYGGASSEAPLLHVFHVDTLQEFSYNEHGGVVRSVLRHADAQTPQIVSGTAYQHNGNHILSQTDARGKTVTHDIDENTDLTRAVTDPNGQQVQYAYTTGTPGTVQQIVSYAYGDADWKDKLTRYNGVDIACDAIGNPIHDGVWTYTWENGRQLRRMACDATVAEFVYNADGLRVQKTVNGVTTNYTLHGKNIVHMTKGNAELHFWYDAQNRPAIVEFNGTKYGYLYNLQGDVIGLIDSANTEVVKYTYDAWGKLLSVTGSLANTIGYYNPFRYRGYVYDVETGLYYLNSRYYCPNLIRFINGDSFVSTSQGVLSSNVFLYCANNPICREDSSGAFFNTICGAIIGAVVAVVTKKKDESVGEALVRGAVTGLIAGVGLDICVATGGVGGLVAAGAFGAAGSALDTAWEAENNGEHASVADCIISGVVGGGLNLLYGASGREANRVIGQTVPEIYKAMEENTIRSVSTRTGKVVLRKVIAESAKNLTASTSQSIFGKAFSIAFSQIYAVLE